MCTTSFHPPFWRALQNFKFGTRIHLAWLPPTVHSNCNEDPSLQSARNFLQQQRSSLHITMLQLVATRARLDARTDLKFWSARQRGWKLVVHINSMSTVRFVWLNQAAKSRFGRQEAVRSAACGCYPMSTVDLQSPATPQQRSRSQHPSSAMRRAIEGSPLALGWQELAIGF